LARRIVSIFLDKMITWGIRALKEKGILTKDCLSILKTPWSEVYAFKTHDGLYYLKQTPKDLFLEVHVMEKLALTFPNSVPKLIASNPSLNCFITKDAGTSLRKYLHETADFECLNQGLYHFLYLQRAIETSVEDYLSLGVPDWRLAQLPKLFTNLLYDETLLTKEGITPLEIQQLKGLTSKLQAQCDALASLEIPETIVQADFHSNNIVIEPETKKLCYLDLGEVVIAHPFFSMINFLLQAIKHHGLKKKDEHYLKLIEICEHYWPNFQKILPQAETIFPIYSALGCYRLMKSIDINAYYQFYGNRHQLGDNLREYLHAR